jgi:hypothetical protein
MTEVEQALAWLRARQAALAKSRADIGYMAASWPGANYYRLATHEADVLAALSWLWDARERAGLNRKTLHMRLTPDQQAVALLCWPRMLRETSELHRKRAFGTYAKFAWDARRDAWREWHNNDD